MGYYEDEVKERTIEVLHSDMCMLLLCGIRYSMGRQSYITDTAIEMVIKYKNALTDGQIKQIRNEIFEALARAESVGKFLGGEVDHKTWRKLAMSLFTSREGNLL